MSDHELHTLTGAYAADALDDDERLAFEAHLQACPACRQEVAELTATAARLGAAARLAPPAELKDRVLAEVGRTRQVPPRSGVAEPADGRAAGRWYRQPVAAAAAALLVVAAGLGALAVHENRQAAQARAMADRIAAVAADPGHTVRTVAVGEGGSGTVVAAGDLAIFRGSQLPRLPGGRAYQLWRIRGQEPESAGVLGRGGDVTGVVTGLAPGDVIGLTVEPAGGSDSPSTEPVLLVPMA